MDNSEIPQEMRASKGIRFAHALIDYLAFLAIAGLITIVLGSISDASGNNAAVTFVSISSIWLNLAAVLLYLAYYFVMETFTSRTLAKFITGTIVIDENGAKPNAKTVFLRTICRLIPLEYFSFLGDRGWHDSISHTYVVKKHIYLLRQNEVLEMDEIGRDSEVV